MKSASIVIYIAFLLGCKAPENDVTIVYQARNDLQQMFKNLSIFRERTGYIFFHTYSGNNRNEYSAIRSHDRIKLHKIRTSFSPDTFLLADKNANQVGEDEEILSDKLKSYIYKLDALQINSISREFADKGISLKIYMKSKKIMIYVPYREKVSNVEWRRYIEQFNKIDDYWYYSSKDR